MMASFHLMRRQLSARIALIDLGQVGERGVGSFNRREPMLFGPQNSCLIPEARDGASSRELSSPIWAFHAWHDDVSYK